HTSTVRVACALLRHRALRHLRLNGQGLTRLSALSLHDALPISFLGGVSGAILAFAYYRAVTPEQFSFNVSIQLVAMVLVGGLGSAIGSFLGAGFVLLAPIFLTNLVAGLAAGGWINISANMIAHVPLMIYGALIIGFLLFEPLGLAKIYDNLRKYFLVWPFRHSRS